MKNIYFLLILIALTSCNTNTPIEIVATPKSDANDPFKASMIQSQFIEINAEQDNVVEGEKGTILTIPKGAFLNKDGDMVEENIRIELAEALNMKDMILSNLTTTSNGKQLESGGMIYINAYDNDGNQLAINKDIPIQINVPAKRKLGGMQVYDGVRDKTGNMNWTNPQPIIEYLTPIDIELLNFYPANFEEVLANGLPFRGHNEPTKHIKDSLFYSMSSHKYTPPKQATGNFSTNINEAHHSPNKQVVDGKYTASSYSYDTDSIAVTEALEEPAEQAEPCGIDPAKIKVIWDKKYNNTLIATREFEARLPFIYAAGKEEILDMYVNNLDKNLYEIDSMVVRYLKEHFVIRNFSNFYDLKQTKVPKADKYAKLLQGHYEKKYKAIKQELNKLHRKAQRALKKKDREAQTLVKQYTKVLDIREANRLESYGFVATSTGWKNIDRGTRPKNWKYHKLETIVSNGDQFDRIYTYVVFEKIKSLYRLNSNNQVNFYAGNPSEKKLETPKYGTTHLITIAYRNDSTFVGRRFEDNQDLDTLYKIAVTYWPQQDLDDMLSQFAEYTDQNRIDNDLEFQEKLYREKLRQERLMKEDLFLKKLWYEVYPCRNEGKQLFMTQCSSCHRTDDKKLTGPGLKDVTLRTPSPLWIYNWVNYSGELIENRDPYALKIYEEYNGIPHTWYHLSRTEMHSILEYIDMSNNVAHERCLLLEKGQ